jgi:hypothetical protein
MTTNPAQVAITNAIQDALIAAAVDPKNTLDRKDVSETTMQVAKEVKPIVDHMTNNEAWYQSRVVWSAIVSAGVVAAGIFGIQSGSIDQKELVEYGILVGAAISGALNLWSRYIAKKPLGA